MCPLRRSCPATRVRPPPRAWTAWRTAARPTASRCGGETYRSSMHWLWHQLQCQRSAEVALLLCAAARAAHLLTGCAAWPRPRTPPGCSVRQVARRGQDRRGRLPLHHRGAGERARPGAVRADLPGGRGAWLGALDGGRERSGEETDYCVEGLGTGALNADLPGVAVAGGCVASATWGPHA